jgi:hypothetical protein
VVASSNTGKAKRRNKEPNEKLKFVVARRQSVVSDHRALGSKHVTVHVSFGFVRHIRGIPFIAMF